VAAPTAIQRDGLGEGGSSSRILSRMANVAAARARHSQDRRSRRDARLSLEQLARRFE